MSNNVIEGFSLSHVGILDGTTSAELVNGDLYGVRSATLTADTGTYDNTGDDAVLSTWNWFNFGTLAVEAGYVPWNVISLLAGTTIDYAATYAGDTTTWGGTAPLESDTTSMASATDAYQMPLWNESSMNQPSRPVIIRVPAKDKLGQPRSFNIVLYKVQFGPFTFTGPSYKSGLLLSYSGKAVMSEFDETGQPLADKAIGRLINLPAVMPAPPAGP